VIKKIKMNTIVNITGITLKLLNVNVEKDMLKKLKTREKAKIWNLKNKEKKIKYNKEWYSKNKKQRLQKGKEWYQKNKEKKLLKGKQWYLKNKEKRLQKSKEWYQKNKHKRKKQIRQYYLKNGEYFKKYNKEWYLKNKKHSIQRGKEWYLKNKERKLKKGKEWYSKNKEYIRKYNKKIRKINPTIRLIKNLRRRTLLALKGKCKSANTMSLLGVSTIEFLWKHLEKSFKSGMTRENHGKWHVDHIIPCASFDLTKPEEQSKCFHYTNLQPLWASENLAKGSKISS